MEYYLRENIVIRIALIARSTLYKVPGGDTVQITETARLLNMAGVQAEIKLANENIDYGRYDLLHFFNITRPADMLCHIKKANKKFVVSPIFIDYSEYDKNYRKGLSAILFKFLSSDGCEYLKTVMRKIKGNDQLLSASFIWNGQRNSIKEILKQASMILPNSKSEYKRLEQCYGIPCNYKVVYNGINTDLFSVGDCQPRESNLVICAARIEGIKNQLNLIKALNNSRYKLLLIGSPSENQTSYYNQCKKIAATNVQFIERVTQHELLNYYKRAEIHILPSFFETTGLSSLEAAAMGCKIIVSDRGDTVEYFGNLAGYCEPDSPESIYNAVEMMAGQPYNSALRKKIVADYTWREATARTLSAYKEVIQSYETSHWNFGYSWNPQ
jgi:glycosyltransferase involved in cell wall biosynthesis